MNEQDKLGEHVHRDTETLMALGIFMTVMSLPVLVATIWAGPPFDQVVNFVAGLTLLGIGLGMLYKGRTALRRFR